MSVQDAISSCQQLIEHATTSTLLKTLLVIVFVFIPVLRVVFSYLKTQKKINQHLKNCYQSYPEKLQKIIKKHSLNSDLFLMSCSDQYIAVSTGIFSKKIILSKKLFENLSFFELEAIVLHEYQHIQQNHAVKILFMELLSKSLFMFPILKDVSEFLRTKFELVADTAAVQNQKTTRYLKSALHKVLSLDSDLQILPHFSYKTLNSRIDMFQNIKPKFDFSLSRLLISSLSFLIFTGMFMFTQSYAMAQTMEDMEAKITCSVFDCVQQCVSYEFSSRTQMMSENNMSLER